MKDKLLLVGAGGFGRVVSEHAEKWYECAFADDGAEIGTEICGIKVIGNTSDLQRLFREYKSLVVTIGNNVLREKLYERAAKIGYTFPNIIHPSAYVSPRAHVGAGCILLNHVVVQNNAVCGDGCILNPGVELHHDSSVGNCCLIYTNSVIRSLARVGDRVRIGSTATVGTGAAVPDDGQVKDGECVS